MQKEEELPRTQKWFESALKFLDHNREAPMMVFAD